MPEYRIDIRLAGYAREHMRRLIYVACRRFNIKGVAKDYVPSIILYGPANSAHEADIIAAVEEAASGSGLVSFRIREFAHFDPGKKWFSNDLRGICLDIEPAESLKTLRAELVERLNTFCELQKPDLGTRLHAVVELGEIDEGRFGELLAYFKANEEKDISQRLLRLSIIRDGRQICEYDLLRKRMVGRERMREPTTIGAALCQIRLSGGEVLQPIWGRARQMAKRRRQGRQLTLVEDNPSIRIPRVFLHRARGIRKAPDARSGRQLTLVDDNPSVRVPKAFILRADTRPGGRANGATFQEKLFTDESKWKNSIISPLMSLPRRLRQRR
ncbi:MAG: hypothetical protein V1875_04480 [Candidatus Altiarchaeota archaeon]